MAGTGLAASPPMSSARVLPEPRQGSCRGTVVVHGKDLARGIAGPQPGPHLPRLRRPATIPTWRVPTWQHATSRPTSQAPAWWHADLREDPATAPAQRPASLHGAACLVGLDTRDLLLRRHWRTDQEANLCVLCPARLHEDRFHLFFNCNFSQRVWYYLQIDWLGGHDVTFCLLHAKKNFQQPFFFEVMLTAAWCIWTTRNWKIFRSERASFGVWRGKFVHDINLLYHRVRESVKPALLAWVNNLP